jgi:polysaccharide biosynthesis transport protein
MTNSGSSNKTRDVLSTTSLSMIRMIWKQKWLLLSVWLMVSILTVAAVRRLRPTYRAEAVVLVESQKIPEHYVSSTVNTEVQDQLATLSQRILSFSQLERIIDDLSLYRQDRNGVTDEQLAERMRKDTTVKLERGWAGNRPGAFRITYVGTNPTEVAHVVNRLCTLFVGENLRSREVQAAGTEEFMLAQLAEARKNLDQLEARVSQYKLSHNGELPEQEQSLVGTLAQLRTALDVSRDNLNRAQDAKATLENNLSMTEITRKAMEKSMAERSQAEAAPLPPPRPQSEILQERYAAMLKRYSADHPDVRALRRAVQAAIDEERSSGQHSASVAPQVKPEVKVAAANTLELDQTRERVRELKSQIAQTEKDFATRKAEQESVLRDISAYQDRLARVPIREQEMAQLMRDYENSKNNYRMLLDKKLSAEMATQMERGQKSELFSILEPARPPTTPISPNRLLLYSGGCLFGLALGIGLSLLLESRKSVFLGEWELPEGVVVLGRLPVVEIHRAVGVDSKKPGFWKRRRLRTQTWAPSAQPLQ